MLRRHHLPVRSVEALWEKQSGLSLEKAAQTECRAKLRSPRGRGVWHAGDSIAISKRTAAIDREIREVPNHWSSESRLFSTPHVGNTGVHTHDAAKKSAEL